MATQTTIFATPTLSTARNFQITQNLSAESTLSVQQSWTEVRKLGREEVGIGHGFPPAVGHFFPGFLGCRISILPGKVIENLAHMNAPGGSQEM